MYQTKTNCCSVSSSTDTSQGADVQCVCAKDTCYLHVVNRREGHDSSSTRHPQPQESLSVADVSWIIQELTRLINLESKQVTPLTLLAATGFRIARAASIFRGWLNSIVSQAPLRHLRIDSR